jgi:hypothetical protein
MAPAPRRPGARQPDGFATMLVARAIPRGAIVVPSAIACWCALLVLVLR